MFFVLYAAVVAVFRADRRKRLADSLGPAAAAVMHTSSYYITSPPCTTVLYTVLYTGCDTV